MKSIRSILIPMIVFLVAIGGSVKLQHRMIDDWRKMPPRFRDTLYLPSSEYVKIVSLGYNHFAADFLWLRMIQVFAGAWSSAENPTQIYNYCDKITDLDPRFNDPYCFAVMGISEESRGAAKNAETNKNPNDPFGTPYLKVAQIDGYLKAIVDKSVVKNPGDYRVPYDGAFFAYWNLNDLQLAKYYVRMAKHDPDYPNYIDRWEGYFELKAGRYRAAYEKFLNDFFTTFRAGNKDLYPINRMQIYRSMNEWFVSEIKQRAQDWQKAHGQWPTIEELRQAGAFKGVELPDVAAITQVIQGVISGAVALDKLNQDQIHALATKTVRQWDDLPKGPFDVVDPRFQGFIIWRTKSPADDKFIIPMLEAVGTVKGFVENVKKEAQEQKQTKGKFPDFSHFAGLISKEDPFGQPWIYDPATGELQCQKYPNVLELNVPDLYIK